MAEKFDEAISYLCDSLYKILYNIPKNIKQQVQEIRLRSPKPVILHLQNESYFLSKKGELTRNSSNTIISTQLDLINSLNKMCSYSVYSYQNEIKNGYITLKGGHRVGLCGTAVFNNEEFTNVKDISSMNIRIARNIDYMLNESVKNLIENFSGILIAGEPSSGKTTILRNIAKNMSIGSFENIKKVVVIDERGELSGTSVGIAQNDLGFCDILNSYPKSIGIMQALRTLSPEIIVCDEIGSDTDIKAIELGVNSGVKFIASIHAGNVEELLRRPQTKKILGTGAFNRIVMLKSKSMPGEISKIFSFPNDLLSPVMKSKNMSTVV